MTVQTESNPTLRQTAQAVLDRFQAGEWVVQGVSGLWWCSEDQPGALVERVTPEQRDALDFLREREILSLETARR